MKIMDEIIIKIKDNSRKKFFLELLEQLDFVELVELGKINKEEQNSDFFDAAGIWKDKDIEPNQLREKAWNL